MKLKNLFALIGLTICIGVTTGCHMRTPFGGPPGNKDFQRSNAVVYDPFPDANAGPNIEGGRPLGYQHPISDTARSQMTTNRRAPGSGY